MFQAVLVITQPFPPSVHLRVEANPPDVIENDRTVHLIV